MAGIYNGGKSFNGYATGVATDVAINDIIGFDITNGNNKTVQTILEMMAARIIYLEEMLGVTVSENNTWEGSGKSTSDLETWLYNIFSKNQPRFAVITLRDAQVALSVSGLTEYAGDLTASVSSDGDGNYNMLIQSTTTSANGLLLGRFSVVDPSAINFTIYPVMMDAFVNIDETVE